MKKLFILGLALLESILSASAVVISKPDDLMTSLAGWDIYKAGTYRYGPSFMIHDDGSIEGWFAAAGGSYGDLYYDGSTDGAANLIASTTDVSQVFTATKDFYCVRVCCPTWGKSDQKVTCALYAWKTSYSVTTRQKPIYTKEINPLTDNMNVTMYNGEEGEKDINVWLPAGRYLWVLSNASSQAGVWYHAKKAKGVTTVAYQNGGSTRLNGSYRMDLQYGTCTSYWDKATYQRSTDGGKTWSEEQTAIIPDQMGRDQLSICDPGVVKFGGYYYLGYTSTENSGGVDNDLYMARSTSPTGPWEKWNGAGWGGLPQPVIVYTDDSTKFGAGEPSMVVVDSTLYLYYTWDNGKPTTRVATASIGDENWPASLYKRGTAIDKSPYNASDHSDVKYIEDIDKWIAVNTSSRMSASAYVDIWISPNGIRFTHLGKLSGPTQPGLHNVGISGDELGHINLNTPQFIAYAYGINSWGQWNTYLQPLQFADGLARADGVGSIRQLDNQTLIYSHHGKIYVDLSEPASITLSQVNGTSQQVKGDRGMNSYSVQKGLYVVACNGFNQKVTVK